MADKTSIEWTRSDDGAPGSTWNPVTGCVKVSPGCDHCYAEVFAERFRGVINHPYEQGFDLRLWPERLDIPRRWRRPRIVFVNSMSDLFQSGVPEEFVAAVWNTMRDTPRHTYQVLTKRPTVMAAMLRRIAPEPLPNVWLGVSVEDQERADLRIPKLLETPAAIRFLSCEPLLNRIALAAWLKSLDWVIVGGESGHGARAMHADWVLDVRDQCTAAGVAFFFKQWGAWTPDQRRVGKHAAGRHLEGRTWDQMPLANMTVQPAG